MSKQILWFRRDLRIDDNAILSNANDEVLPIFIFDKNILSNLNNNDQRVLFIYNNVMNLKNNLKKIGLDLKIFFDTPINVFIKLKELYSFDNILCSCDYESYSINRDLQIDKIIPMIRYYDSYILNPNDGLKNDNTPYTIFTPFYKSLKHIWEKESLVEYNMNHNLKLINNIIDFNDYPSLDDLGFIFNNINPILNTNPIQLLNEFISKINSYNINRDYFYLNSTSNLSIHLRFGTISPRQVFNFIKKQKLNSDVFIKELFWREFWAYILLHFPNSQFNNFNNLNVDWNNNLEHFHKWCNGQTGIPIIDAAMINFNNTGMMHNRLRMIVASFLCKNLFLPWQWGEKYFASKLLDYDAASNIGSWQWAASTGADGSPYFRVFNPYTQSEKFDPNALFIKSIIPSLKNINSKNIHMENGIDNYISIVDIKISRLNAIRKFKDSIS